MDFEEIINKFLRQIELFLRDEISGRGFGNAAGISGNGPALKLKRRAISNCPYGTPCRAAGEDDDEDEDEDEDDSPLARIGKT